MLKGRRGEWSILEQGKGKTRGRPYLDSLCNVAELQIGLRGTRFPVDELVERSGKTPRAIGRDHVAADGISIFKGQWARPRRNALERERPVRVH